MKCRICKVEITSQSVKEGRHIKITYEGKNAYFCCEEHCKEYIEQDKAKKLFFKQRDEIDKYVKENIFFYRDGQTLPKGSFYDKIADLYNGTQRFGGEVKNGRKDGYPMEAILNTFKSQQGAILYAFRNKNFTKESSKLSYMWAIIESNINDEYEAWERTNRINANLSNVSEEKQEEVARMFEIEPTVVSPSEDRSDLSWVLNHFDD